MMNAMHTRAIAAVTAAAVISIGLLAASHQQPAKPESWPIPKETAERLQGQYQAAIGAANGKQSVDGLIVDKTNPCFAQVLAMVAKDAESKAATFANTILTERIQLGVPKEADLNLQSWTFEIKKKP